MEAGLALIPKSVVQLSEIRSFLQSVNTFYSSTVTIPWDSRKLYVGLKRRDMRESEDDVGPSNRLICPSLEYSFEEKGALIRTLVACPTWTHARFDFRYMYDFQPVSNKVMLELFALLRSCRCLSTLDLQFGSSHILLSTLLCGNPFLETLILNVGWAGVDIEKHTESIAEYLSRNSVLKSFTLVLNYSANSLSMETLLRPFLSSSQNEANVVLKELVIRSQYWIREPKWHDVEAIVNLVRCNTTIEKLDFCLLYYYADLRCKLIAGALEVNHTLKEFRLQCSVSTLKELVQVLVPDIVSGHQPNTSLSSLRLLPTYSCLGADYMNELARMLESNTTLKHVQVLGVWIAWDDNNLKIPRYVQSKTRDKLELMMNNELRLNSSLQSLVVGHWKLLRVGPEWHMTYQGPCFSTSIVKEYLVKVKTHR